MRKSEVQKGLVAVPDCTAWPCPHSARPPSLFSAEVGNDRGERLEAPGGGLGWEKGLQVRRKQCARSGGWVCSDEVAPLLQCHTGSHSVLCGSRALEAWAGQGRLAVVEGFSNQTYQEGRKD